MRKIKFRGQRQSDNKWIYGDLLHPNDFVNVYEISDCNTFDGSRYDVIEDTIGQFTGLHDKNGKEIYEGDVVEITYKGEEDIGKIIYEYNGFTVDVMNMNKPYGRVDLIARYIEVIGNIYENSNLLKGADNIE